MARWFGVHGGLSNHEGLFVRSPVPRPPDPTTGSNEAVVQSVLKAFSIDREIALDSAPAVSQYSSGGQQGYSMETTFDVHDGGGLSPEEFAAFLGTRAWRNSFYKMMLLDVMCGSIQGKSPNTLTRNTTAMGFREFASKDNQWHGTNLEHMFKSRTPDGGMALFPFNLFDDDNFGSTDENGNWIESKLDNLPMRQKVDFKAPKFGLQGSDEETTEIDYSSEIQEFLEKALPKLDVNKESFVRSKSDEDNEDLWHQPLQLLASYQQGYLQYVRKETLRLYCNQEPLVLSSLRLSQAYP